MDAERALTGRGQRQAQTAGAALAHLGASFDRVLFSPKVRARQTAELAAAEWEESQRKRLRVHAALANGIDARQAQRALSKLAVNGRLLLVGHEPHLSRLVHELTGSSVSLRKGGVAVVRLNRVGGELVALLRPRDLALIAGLPRRGD